MKFDVRCGDIEEYGYKKYLNNIVFIIAFTH